MLIGSQGLLFTTLVLSSESARMPSAKDQGFTEDQIEDFKEVFQLFDTKGDGLIQVRRKLVLTKQASNHCFLYTWPVI